MKHKITCIVEQKKYFLGIPYTVKEKKTARVDGKTYRKYHQAQNRSVPYSIEEMMFYDCLFEDNKKDSV